MSAKTEQGMSLSQLGNDASALVVNSCEIKPALMENRGVSRVMSRDIQKAGMATRPAKFFRQRSR